MIVEINLTDLLESEAVKGMDATTFGAYMLLLFESYKEQPPGYLIKDKEYLYKISRCTLEQRPEIAKKVLIKFKPTDDGKYIYNKKVLKVIEEQKNKTTKDKKKILSEKQELQNNCLDLYIEFHKKMLNGLEPKINGIQIKALTELINYFKKQCNGNNAEVVNSFKLLFDYWHLLSNEYKHKILLTNINYNLSNILYQLNPNAKSNLHERKSQFDELRNKIKSHE